MKANSRAIVYGCGPMGCNIARLVVQRKNIDLVGAVDIDPEKAGRDLGDVAGLERELGVRVSSDVERVLAESRPDVAFHATSSRLGRVHEQIAGVVKAGANVVSTCEELSFPYRRHPDLAADLDRLAKAHKVTILGTGINPGFVMDAWPLFMTGACQEVQHVRVVRIQDASSRRLPFQSKIGAGCTPDQFDNLVKAGVLRHVGLAESVSMIASGLGWQLVDITETIEPVMATQEVKSEYLTVRPGQAAGIRQVCHGIGDGRQLITLEFQAYLGASESYDAVYITGTPNVEVVVNGGIHGDTATAAVVVNAHHRVLEAPSGLLTMKDMPPVICAR